MKKENKTLKLIKLRRAPVAPPTKIIENKLKKISKMCCRTSKSCAKSLDF